MRTNPEVVVHDLRELAAFFQDDVDNALSKLRVNHSFYFDTSSVLDKSLRTGLLAGYFELSYRALIGHFKLVEQKIDYSTYCNALSGTSLREHVYSNYPVLRRWMAQLGESWGIQHDLILSRLRNDRAAIYTEIFEGDLLPPLESIRTGMGDAHNGGATVAVLTFEGGKRLVYKPRSLQIDAHFSDLLTWTNGFCDLELKTPRQLTRPEYGWVEFVPYVSCERHSDVELFYRRTGGLLCLLYVLEASDFHYENVVANGSSPVLVDLETFFHPRRSGDAPEGSVLRTGLLPTRFFIGNTENADVSGMADVDGQEGVVAKAYLEQDEVGNLVFRRGKGKLIGKQNVPMLDGVKVELTADLHDALQKGFAQVYRILMSNKDALRARLEVFKHDEIRVLLRNTVAYTHLLDEARHPSLLLSEDRNATHFSMLDVNSSDQNIQNILDYEVESLRDLDIPIFAVGVASVDLKVGDRLLPSFYALSGYDVVIENVDRLDAADLSRQLWTIDRALKLKGGGVDPPSAQAIAPDELRQHDEPRELRKRFMDLAADSAQFVVDQIHQGDSDASWLVVRSATLDGQEQQVASPLYDLHAGMPGEILFLSQASTHLPGNWRSVADKAYQSLSEFTDRHRLAVDAVGMFTGWGGIIYLLSSLAKTYDDHRFDDEVERLLQLVDFRGMIDRDRNFSLLSGSAGLIWALANYSIASGSGTALALAKIAAEHLMAHRHATGPGYSWRIFSASPLTGLAHGASGFAVAFARLYQACGDPAFRDASLAAIAYERALYVPEESNWRDLRDYTLKHGGPRCATTWAHGAPGIGLARLCLLQAGIDDGLVQEELDGAMRTTLAHGVQGQPSLVAGGLGSLELPLSYAEQVGGRYWPQTVALLHEAADLVEERLAALQSRSIAPLGLMTGVTGLGYQCLRIARGTSIPSLLNFRGSAAACELDWAGGSMKRSLPRRAKL